VPDVFAAIADPTRRSLIDLLGTQPGLPVHALAEPFSMTRPAISQHLRILRDAGLVTEHRVGRERRYQLRVAPLREVSDWVVKYERFWQQHPSSLGKNLDAHAEDQNRAAQPAARA
jgi:DNA-binding transcriptional ArsR family regulator